VSSELGNGKPRTLVSCSRGFGDLFQSKKKTRDDKYRYPKIWAKRIGGITKGFCLDKAGFNQTSEGKHVANAANRKKVLPDIRREVFIVLESHVVLGEIPKGE